MLLASVKKMVDAIKNDVRILSSGKKYWKICKQNLRFYSLLWL